MPLLRNRLNILFVCAVALLLSCKKDRRPVSADVLPETDSHQFAVFNGLPVYGHTSGLQPVASYNDRHRFIGSVIDPSFGKVDVGLYVNYALPLSNLKFPGAVVDSAAVVLMVDTSRFAGARYASFTFSVYPLNEIMDPKAAYFTNNNNLHSSTPVASGVAGRYGKDTLGLRRLQIRIDNNFAAAILADEAALADNSAFMNKYRGFYITGSAAGNGALHVCDLADAESGLMIYYRDNASATTTKRLRFSFGAEGTSRFNTVKYDSTQAHSELIAQLQGDTSAGRNHLFVHGLSVSRGEIQIPFFQKNDTFNVSVNRAEVIFYFDPVLSSVPGFAWPPFLTLVPVDVAGKDTFAIDQGNTLDNGRYQGHLDMGKAAYVFNISRHAQAIFNGEKRNNGFRLVVANPDRLVTPRRDTYFERIILYGSAHPSKKPVLNLSVVRLDK